MTGKVIIPKRNWDEFVSWLRSANLPTILSRDEGAEFFRRVNDLLKGKRLERD